jgi:hypothetical protein
MASNGGLGISLGGRCDTKATPTPNDIGDADSGPNNRQNYPVITSALGGPTIFERKTIAGTLDSTPLTTFALEFFASESCDPSGNGEGRSVIARASVTTDSSGHASFRVVDAFNDPQRPIVTATATSSGSAPRNTSEFSACVPTMPDTRATTTTTLTSSPNPSAPGQPITFTATITGNNPTGAIQFFQNCFFSAVATVPISNGKAEWVMTGSDLLFPVPSVGQFDICARYIGDDGNRNSESNTVRQVVSLSTTTTTVIHQ